MTEYKSYDGFDPLTIEANGTEPEEVVVIGPAPPPGKKMPTGFKDRISEDYLTQQKLMHEHDPSYGISGSRRALEIDAIVDEAGYRSVLDYGCGKGTLKTELERLDCEAEIREYDPAIPGKDHEPEMADLVVCSDVLEHIEPDKLDNVLEHIRSLAMKYVFITIATRPALKSLPDGTNAHKIIRDAAWWRAKLSAFFDIKIVEDRVSRHDIEVTELVIMGEPFLLIGDIVPVAVLGEDRRFENAKVNVTLTSKRLKLTPPHTRVAILACFGPSLKATWPSIVEEYHLLSEWEGGDIVTVSGAHDFLVERGVIPKYHIECDPRPHKTQMSQMLRDDITYLYASACDPSVVGRLKGKDNLVIWHLESNDYRIRKELEPNAIMVGGGSSVGLRAFGVLTTLGYRRFIVHGMDCSYDEEGSHAGEHTGKKQKRIEVRSYGRSFISTPVLLSQVREFDDLRQNFVGLPPEKIEIIMRGDGLLQHSLRMTPGATTPVANLIDGIEHAAYERHGSAPTGSADHG